MQMKHYHIITHFADGKCKSQEILRKGDIVCLSESNGDKDYGGCSFRETPISWEMEYVNAY